MAVTKQGNNAHLYINSIYIGSTPSHTYQTGLSNTQNILIGVWNDHNRYFTGDIDDVRIYDRALNQREIDALFVYGEHNPEMRSLANSAFYSMYTEDMEYGSTTGASTVLSTRYGGSGGTPTSSLNQGRVSGISDWGTGAFGGSATNQAVYISAWFSDGETGNEQYGETHDWIYPCTPFNLTSDDYIIGFRVHFQSPTSYLRGLELYTLNGNQYECLAPDMTGYIYETVSYFVDPYDFYYLTGWKGNAGGIIDAIQFEFTEITFDSFGKNRLFANSAVPMPQFDEIVGSSARTYCLSAQFYSDSDPSLQCLLSTGSASTSNAFNIVKYSSHIGVMGYSDDFYPISGSLTYDITDWNHYCIAFDGTYITIYVNGEIDNVVANPSLSTAAPASQSNYMGQSNHLPNSAEPFYGLMRNLRLFPMVLTQTQIQLLNTYDNLHIIPEGVVSDLLCDQDSWTVTSSVGDYSFTTTPPCSATNIENYVPNGDCFMYYDGAGSTSWSNYTIRVTVNLATGVSGNYPHFGISFYTDPASGIDTNTPGGQKNGYMLRVNMDTQLASLDKAWTGGDHHDLAGIYSFTGDNQIEYGTDYHITLIAHDYHVIAYWNDILIIDHVETTYMTPPGTIGLFGKSGVSATFSDLEMEFQSGSFERGTYSPTHLPTPAPTSPTNNPTPAPTSNPTPSPTSNPTPAPTANPTAAPTVNPTPAPTNNPTRAPTPAPTANPTRAPTYNPTPAPTGNPTPAPTFNPTPAPTNNPTPAPTNNPTPAPTN
eukprot:1068958_1